MNGHYSHYFAEGARVMFGAPGDCYHAATCDDATLAAERLNQAQWLNDAKRRYTAAARQIALVESMPGFVWADRELTA